MSNRKASIERIVPHLIQRGTWNDRPYKKAIDSIIEFDYMGAAEFEWGALPESYKRMKEAYAIGKYELFTLEDEFINNSGSPLNIFCQADEIEYVKEHLLKFKENSIRLKEYIYFHTNYKNPEDIEWYEKNVDRENFWWNIKHDYMFFFGGQDRINKFMNVAFSLEEEQDDGKLQPNS